MRRGADVAGLFAAIVIALAPAAVGAQVEGKPREAGAGVADELARDARIRGRLEGRLVALRNAKAFPGAGLGVVLPGGGELAVAVGYADVEERVPLAPEHRFLAGSVGKTYVGALALLLAHEERLTLDDELSRWLGDEPWFARLPGAERIRLAHLLRHQSGLPRYVFRREFWDERLGDPDRTFAPADLIAYVLDAEPLFAPGEDWAYSDTNYLLVGLVLERAAGQGYYDLLRERLLEPLGLRDTVPSDRRDLPQLAVGYTSPKNPFGLPERLSKGGRYVFNPQFEWTGGGLATTPMDLARWAAILYRGQAFDAPYREELLESVPCSLGPGRRYGVATIVVPTAAGPMYGHSGFFPGYLTVMGYFAEHDLALAFQMNSDDGRRLGRRLSELLAELAGIVIAELE